MTASALVLLAAVTGAAGGIAWAVLCNEYDPGGPHWGTYIAYVAGFLLSSVVGASTAFVLWRRWSRLAWYCALCPIAILMVMALDCCETYPREAGLLISVAAPIGLMLVALWSKHETTLG